MRQAGGRGATRPAPGRPSGADRVATLLLGDEQPLIRRGLRAVLGGDPALRIQGEAGDGDTLLELARRHRPDLVLLDSALPGPDVIETVHRLAADLPGGVSAVLLTAQRDLTGDLVLRAVHAGVRGFLFKWGEPEEILAGVRAVTGGGFAMSADVIGQLLGALRRPRGEITPCPRADISLLTPREMQVFLLVAQGLTNQQISAALVLSDATVKSHFHRICHKLALRNRVDAVILAYETGVAGARNALGPPGPASETTGITGAPPGAQSAAVDGAGAAILPVG